MENALLVSRLNKSAGRFKILHNVTFNVPKGAVCAFIGHNGAGKTTTIKSIMGLFNFDSGLIEINGVNSKNVIISHSNIGYVPEKDNFPKIKVRRFLRDMNKLYGVDKRETDKRIDYYAKIFSLTH
jgi:ABC-2 type transport system ATP-binding protein